MLFWDLSLGEVVDCIEAYAKRLKRENDTREAKAKDDMAMLYVQSMQIMNMIAHVINPKEVAIQPLSAYYPGLFTLEEDPGKEFTEQEEEEEDKHKLSPEMELHKARMDDFIFRHNRAFAQKRGENSGRNDIGEAASNNRGSDESILSGASEGTAADQISHNSSGSPN